MSDTIAIVGAGHAAGELASALRQGGHEGRIVMVGEERWLPYQRPPLSKGYLSSAGEIDGLYLRPQATFDGARIEFIGATRVVSIDRAGKALVLSDGMRLAYDRLAIATGTRVRRLATVDAARADVAPNVHYLRSFDDLVRLRPQFVAGRHVTIVGGGYIGLEVASAAVKQALSVTVLEAAARVLARVTAPEISAFYEQLHRTAGVDLRTGVAVRGFEFDADGRVTAVRCRPAGAADDFLVATDLVVVGIGVVPNSELAAAAGLAVNDGIVVDETTRTSDPDIVAAGDCTRHPNAIVGRDVRLESVPNAVEQARAAAATLCGQARPYRTVPWFWSDQYDLKLQMVGLSHGYDRLVLRGDPALRSFTAFYLHDGLVVAADCVGRPKEFMLSKRIVAARVPASPESLADESFDLKSLVPANEAIRS